MKKHYQSLINLYVAILILFGSGFAQAQSNGFEVIKTMELLDLIYEHLDKYYVDEPQPGKMAKVGIDAMLRELDPYTVYYHENNIEDYRLMTTGQYGGVGALIRPINDRVHFVEPYENSPAQKAGIRAGDIILEIDGIDMREKPSDQVSSSLKGPKGSEVKIKVERNGKTEIFTVTRDEIKLPDVPYSGFLDEGTGYIKLNSFTQTASSAVKDAYNQMKPNGLERLVLDLRGNGGGLLIEAVRIVNMFVPRGQVVVTTKGRVSEENRVYKTMEAPLDTKIPLVVLIDGGSASASEIVAGSLQDLDRAVVIGQTSFGKGLVQRTYDLKYGSKMKLTIAKYYTPSGRCVQRLEYYDRNKDIKPQEVPDSLIKTFKTKNGREVIDGRGIEPEIEVEQREISRIAATLYANNVMYHYATDFFHKNENIPPAKEFALSDQQLEDFKQYALNAEFTYSTQSEERLKEWKEVAEKEGYFKIAESEYTQLMSKVASSKERDFDIFKDEIRELLENEIVSRYYYQRGRAENNFRHDEVVKTALQILKDTKEYKDLLN